MAQRRPYPWPLPCITAVVVLVILLVAAGRRLQRVEVQGDSMAPGLQPGDRLLAVRGLDPRGGDIVTAADPRQRSRVLVKRVASVTRADGVELAGDNPGASTDSRTFGPVPLAMIQARVLWRYWPPPRRGCLTAQPGAGGERPAVLG